MTKEKVEQITREELSRIGLVITVDRSRGLYRIERKWPCVKATILAAVAELDKLAEIYKMEKEKK